MAWLRAVAVELMSGQTLRRDGSVTGPWRVTGGEAELRVWGSAASRAELWFAVYRDENGGSGFGEAVTSRAAKGSGGGAVAIIQGSVCRVGKSHTFR